MEWVLAILFGTAILLLIVVFVKEKQSSLKTDKEVDQLTFSVMDEVHQLQEQIRKLEIDGEITVQEAGLLAIDSEYRLQLRTLLYLYKRGYSIETIAEKQQLTVDEVTSLLSPYMKEKDEGRMVANEG
ncbi:hypothetical protein [Bacillus sp. FJAT-50079]|uniref:hypothetical protein n=1 Tax=Bacillus sp. FJAT-50079 TaxID=2833577 RepID=UPI001BC8FBAA|nr:hypothetical protein [Bacillus sp. FJAT-50079]MBS4207485.1 hypothetical protein [Bacillus sp. FJAT-50079]